MDSKNSTIKIERAISELRRGGKIVISDNNTGVSIVLFAAELIQKETIEEMNIDFTKIDKSDFECLQLK